MFFKVWYKITVKYNNIPLKFPVNCVKSFELYFVQSGGFHIINRGGLRHFNAKQVENVRQTV